MLSDFNLLQERPYEFRYAPRIIPIEKVVRTDLNEVKRVATELAAKIGENETFRVTVEKRFTTIHSRDFIEAAAAITIPIVAAAIILKKKERKK